MDFGESGAISRESTPTSTNPTIIGDGTAPITDLNNPTDSNTNPDNGNLEVNASTDPNEAKPKQNTGDGESSSIELVAGTTIEIGDEVYTVDDNGNVLDKDGKVFKNANEVDDWIKDFDKIEEETSNDLSLSIKTIQDKLGVSIVDESDKPIEFENSVEGVAAYVNAVIEQSRDNHLKEGVNELFTAYPIVKDFLNYYIANGNSIDGFGQVLDRSDVEFKSNDEEQHIAIIRTAWEEQNRKGDVNSYIDYLKSSNTLAAVAEEELNGIKEADAQRKKQIEEEAARREAEENEANRIYWNEIKTLIESGTIGDYKIPETFVATRDGQKFNVSRKDFFNYLYQVDKNGLTRYQKDLQSMDSKAVQNDSLLRAYLTYVGGDYSTLVSMAINKEKVSTLRIKSKEAKSGTIKISKPTPVKKTSDYDFGN